VLAATAGAVALVVVGAVAAGRMDGAGRRASPAATTAPATGPDGPGVVPDAATLRAWGLPSRLALPDGLSGRLHLAVRDRALLEVDLGTGAVTARPAPDQADVLALHVLGDGTDVAADQTTVSVRRAGTDTFVPVAGLVGGYLQILAADDATVVVSHAAPDRNELWLIGPDGTARPAAERLQQGRDWSTARLGLRDGRLVTGFAQAIGVVDPDRGTGSAVADGALIAADDRTVVRTVCDATLRCTLRSGPYDDPDRWVVGLDGPLQATLLSAQLSPDGRRLLVSTYDGGVVLTLVDLTTGALRPVPEGLPTTPFELAARFTADGRWLIVAEASGVVLIETATDARLRIELGPANQIGAIDVTA